MSTNKFMDTNRGRRAHRRWPDALKREIVAASLTPGASVSVVARQYDVNANQVFGWRRRFGPATSVVATSVPPTSRPRMVPVTIGVEPDGDAPPPSVPNTITIEIAGAYLVRVGANFDCRLLRRVLDCLVRR